MALKKPTRTLTRSQQETASTRRDAEFFADRRRREELNLRRTLELRALRLAHEAANPPPKPAEKARKTKRASQRADTPEL